MNREYWQGKICLVTGGSAGLGLALAGKLADCGANLVLAARDETRLSAASEQLRTRGAQEVLTVPTQIVWQEDVDRLQESVVTQFGRLDMLVNCAGRSARGKALETNVEDFQQLMDVNFLGTVRVTQAFAQLLLESKGHVVNIGSLASKVASRYLGGYPASKFALAAYTQQLRLENSADGLHALLVCPGPIAGADVARYSEAAAALPSSAAKAGGGAKLKAIEPDWLAEKILAACEQRRSELVVPGKARILFALSHLSPSWGDWLLDKFIPN